MVINEIGCLLEKETWRHLCWLIKEWQKISRKKLFAVPSSIQFLVLIPYTVLDVISLSAEGDLTLCHVCFPPPSVSNGSKKKLRGDMLATQLTDSVLEAKNVKQVSIFETCWSAVMPKHFTCTFFFSSQELIFSPSGSHRILGNTLALLTHWCNASEG